MLDARELRIGNFVRRIQDNEEIEIEAYQLGTSFIDDFEPIEINEELVIKLGFNKRSFSCFKINNFYIDFRNDEILEKQRVIFSRWDNYHCLYFNVTDIKYVHQLQNLYFALTGEELNIN